MNHVTLLSQWVGGSVIDTGRMIARIAKSGGNVKDYEGGFRPDFLPLAIPTTHGTGSEVSTSSVITDPVNKYKVLCSCGASRIALLDPLLAVKLPPALAASTGIDALTHAIESFTAIDSTL